MQNVLARLPSTQTALKIYGIAARKSLSQNFLHNGRMADRIVRQMGRLDLSSSFVVEVGPGPGILTRALINANARDMVVVERDKRFLPILEQLAATQTGSMRIVHGDALNFRLRDIKELTQSKDVHIIGNLPFSISTALLMLYLEDICLHHGEGLPTLTLMFQREVADRMVELEAAGRSDTHTSDAVPFAVRQSKRSRLSAVVQALCDARVCLDVPSSAFRPQPKVSGAVVRLVPLAQPLIAPTLDGFVRFNNVLRMSFAHRSKTIQNNLRFRLSTQETDLVLQKSGIPTHWRPAEISTREYAALTKAIDDLGLKIAPYRPNSSRRTSSQVLAV